MAKKENLIKRNINPEIIKNIDLMDICVNEKEFLISALELEHEKREQDKPKLKKKYESLIEMYFRD